MKRTILTTFFLMLAAVNAFPAVLARSVRSLPATVPGEVLVKFRSGADAAARGSAVRSWGTLKTRRRASFDKIHLAPGTPMEAVLKSLREDPRVEWAQPNHRFHALCLPGDPYAALNNWPFLQIEAAAGWDAYVAPAVCPGVVPGSSSVTVAVLDSGVYAAHPDLAPALAASSLWYNSLDATTQVEDDNGHGTFLCGLIGARWDGTLGSGVPHPSPCSSSLYFIGGMAGLAGQLTILPVKVLDAEGNGTTESIADGMDHAIANGARILNLSLGGAQFEWAEQEAVDRALAAGCIVVAAAGNDAGGILYPAAYPPVVAVGATGPEGTVASYSNRGPNLDLVAPGGAGTARNPTEALSSEILSTLMCPTPEGYFLLPNGDNHYGLGVGTSFATPYVSAAMALVWSRFPAWTSRQVVERVIGSTVDIGAPGWDTVSGYGLLNLKRAMTGEIQRYAFTRTFNSPNPFHPEDDEYTNLTLVLDAPARVELEIRDAAGNRVLKRTFEASELNSNPENPQYKSYYLSWDGRNGAGNLVVSGVYPYTVKVNGQTGRNKIVVIRGRR